MREPTAPALLRLSSCKQNVEQDEENEGAYRPRTAQAVQL